jgi:SAM-dependent methyltransferase
MTNDLTVESVARVLTQHVRLYKTVTPTYQTMMLRSLRQLWDPAHRRMLDVGGGTGVIAQAVKDLFGIDDVTSVDIEDRFLATLDIETRLFDGASLPFADGSFDCLTLNNVLHHVPTAVRPGLMRECRRVVGAGPVYVKDHVAASALDHWRLTVLDAMGNAPFGGMIRASYLSRGDWQSLAADAGFRIDGYAYADYRSGLFKALFPNRLEVTMRWLPLMSPR